MDLNNRLLILLFPNAYVKFRVVCGWLREILGGFRWFWMVSGGFGWFRVVSDGFEWFAVLAVTVLFTSLPFLKKLLFKVTDINSK